MSKWSEFAGGSRLPNQCFSMKLGKFKLRFDTADEANNFLEATNQLASQESYECNACSGWHLTSKQRGGMKQQRKG